MTDTEQERAAALIPVVEDSLRQEAILRDKDLDEMVASGKIIKNVIKSVICDVVARTLMTATDQEPLSQFAQSALGYTVSGTYLTPGGGLFIKKSELARLGLNRQRGGWLSLVND